MALLTIQRASQNGTVITTATPSASDTFAPSSDGVLDVNNASGVSTAVTVAVPGVDQYGVTRADRVVTVAAGTRRRFGLGPNGRGFPADLADPADDLVHISTTPTASVTIVYTD